MLAALRTLAGGGGLILGVPEPEHAHRTVLHRHRRSSRYLARCEVSRTTVTNYLQVLEDTLVVILVRPFSTRRTTEIVAAPKINGFDTGLVCNLLS